MIVLDASVLIAFLNPDDAHNERATEMLAESADEPFGTSPITMAEVLTGPVKAGRMATIAPMLRELAIDSIALPPDAAIRLATLRASTALKLPDCCVLLAAEQTTATLATYDERLATAAADRGIPVWVTTDRS